MKFSQLRKLIFVSLSVITILSGCSDSKPSTSPDTQDSTIKNSNEDSTSNPSTDTIEQVKPLIINEADPINQKTINDYINSGKTTEVNKTYTVIQPDSLIDSNFIKGLYTQWTKDMLSEKLRWASDSCQGEWFDHEGRYYTYIENKTVPEGLPNEEKIKWQFADINSDGLLDGFLSFGSCRCYRGSADNWMNNILLFISDGNKYKVIDTPIIEELYIKDSSYGWKYLGIGPDRIFIRSVEWLDEDAHCCPSIFKILEYQYSSGKIITSTNLITPN